MKLCTECAADIDWATDGEVVQLCKGCSASLREGRRIGIIVPMGGTPIEKLPETMTQIIVVNGKERVVSFYTA